MNNWKVWIESIKEKPYSALGLLVLLALPVTLLLVFRSQDTRTSAAAPDKLETESGTLSSSGVSKQNDSGASGGQFVRFDASAGPTPTNAPQPTNPPSSGGSIVGPGIHASTGKSNRQLREGAHAIVFVADTSSQVRYVRLPWTNRQDPYGGGNGGNFRFGFQGVTSQGFPNGSWIGQTVTKNVPIQGGAFIEEIVFSSGPTLQQNQKYAFVMENVSSSPNSNWGSPNMLYTPGHGSTQPRNPDHVWLNGSFYTDPFDWTTSSSTTPTWDLSYANGVHEGFSGMRGANTEACPVSGTCRWVFEHDGPSRSVSQVCAAWANGTGSGTTSVNVTVNGSQRATASLGTTTPWACGNLSSSVALSDGDDVVVRFSGSSKELGIILTRDGQADDEGHPMVSFPYTGPMHYAYVGSSGTTGAWDAWKAHTVYQVYMK